MDADTRRLVRSRAGNRCEYCGLHKDESPLIPLQVEHVLPKKHGGSDHLDNLALACIDCNLHKGTNIAGLDPETAKLTPLFNPRKQDWDEHFLLIEVEIHGHTAIGRVTVQVLDLNGPDRIELRLLHRSE
jgi:hypothetical protein